MRFELLETFLAALTLVSISCELLKTRDPELPTQSNTTNAPANSADALIQNLASAIQQKNVEEYAKVFSDTLSGTRTYRFVPTQASTVRYTVVFSHWSKDSERDYFQTVLANLRTASTPNISFLNQNTVTYQADSALFSADYVLFVPHNNANLTTTFKGRSYFYLAPNKSSGVWTMYRWDDFETHKDSSWSELKGQFGK